MTFSFTLTQSQKPTLMMKSFSIVGEKPESVQDSIKVRPRNFAQKGFLVLLRNLLLEITLFIGKILFEASFHFIRYYALWTKQVGIMMLLRHS